MKTDIVQNEMWWKWVENCDRCGKLIRDHSIRSPYEPNVTESDFCLDCLNYFLEVKIFQILKDGLSNS